MIKNSHILQYAYIPDNPNDQGSYSLGHHGTPQNPIMQSCPYGMLLLIRSGKSTFITKDFCISSNSPCLVIYGKNAFQAQFNQSNIPYEKYMIRFRDISSPGLLPLYHQIYKCIDNPCAVIPLAEAEINWLYQICDHIMKLLLEEKLAHTDVRVLNPYRFLLTEIIRLLQQPRTEHEIKASPHMMRVLSYIADHLTEKISLDDIAEYAHIGKTKLCSDFKGNFSSTVHQYILHQRLILSKQYLDQGFSVNEVSELCGFSDGAHFVHAFKKYFHITPLQYRNADEQM